MIEELEDNQRLGQWNEGVAFIYDHANKIIGCWDINRSYNMFEIRESELLSDLLHKEMQRNIKGGQNDK